MATEPRRMAIEPGLHVRPCGSNVSVHVLLEAGLQCSGPVLRVLASSWCSQWGPRSL